MTYKTHREIAEMDNLETIFSKAYSAEYLITFLDQFQKGAAVDPKTLNAITKKPILQPSGKILKKHRAAALQEVFKDKNLTLILYNQQSDLCRQILDILVWYGEKSLSLLERLLNKKISKTNSSFRSYVEPFFLNDGLELLLLEQHHGMSSYRQKDKKENIMVFLPEEITKALRESIPKPAEYYLSFLKQKTRTAFSHCSEMAALTEIPRIIQFISLGHLALKKNGQPTAKGLRELSKVSELKEFYPNADTNEIHQLKSTMLTTFLLTTSQKTFRKISESNEKPQDLLRIIFREWLNSNDFTFIEQYLSHLRIERSRSYYASSNTTNIKKNLLLILKEMQPDAWVSLADINSFTVVRQINLLEFAREIIEFRHFEENKYRNGEEWDTVKTTNATEVIYFPLLKAFFFLAAALGLVEIGYNLPKNSTYNRLNCQYLSEYDGLKIVRLTQLGAYVAGKTRKFTANIPENTACQLHLDKTRLLLTMEGIDPLVDLNLKKVMEPVGAGRYMLTYASLLKECSNKQDVNKKITLFKKTISQTSPKIWRDFFTMALKRVNPLTVDPAYRVFKIEQNQDLLRILTSDPNISALILKVEGLRIAVELPNLSKFVRLLKTHGYLVSNTSLFNPLA